MAQGRLKSNALYPSHKHTSKPSEETNASGLAESAISYSAFPEPPSSIPPTPIRSVFGSSGPSISNSHVPDPPRHKSPQANTNSISKRDNDVTSISTSNISPYDWHEGSSSIDVDAAEDRLLPTSFITSLLRENAGPRGANRASYSSDAISGISEMTYPPRNPFIDSLRDSSPGPSKNPSQNPSRRQSYRGPLPRPVGGRAPSSAQFQGRGRGIGVSDGLDPGSTDYGQTSSRSGSALSQSTLTAGPSDSSRKSGRKLAVYNEVDESEEGPHQDVQTNSSSGFATSETHLAQRRPAPNPSVDPHGRESIYSTRSAAPSFVSRISFRRMLTWRRKPLPPVPTIPHIPIATEREHRRIEEQAPLPDLVNRANQLHVLLEKGYHPHQSISSYPTKTEQVTSSFEDAETIAQFHREREVRRSSPFSYSRVVLWLKRNKLWVTLGIFVVIAIIAIGSAVGVTAQRNRIQKSSCSAGTTGGASCNLNTTCVCTGATSSSCSPVARAVLDIVPIMNDRLSTNLTISAVYNGLWIIQGSVQGASCVEQADLIDISAAIDFQRYPNRTQWAQAALLWTLIQTQDRPPAAQLRDFILKAPWAQLQGSDGPITSAGSTFTTSTAGFSYDFAAQNIIALPATFAEEGQPLNTQISKVDNRIRSSLDHVYSYAVASSNQRDNALRNYWMTVLHQGEERLKLFKDAFRASPIILPFDATSPAIRSLYNSNSFPPPPACYPGLKSEQRDFIGLVEGKAFNLAPPANIATQFDSNCFPLHPAYGVLNVLRLRLPFLDSQSNTAKQGIVLNSDVAPRAILAVGEALAALPGPINSTRSQATAVDPRNYGTTAYASHIILQYLSSVSVNVANAIIYHVLNSSATPPPPNSASESALFPLESIPTLEVAIFGNIETSDVDSYVSSFTSSSGSLFFGSDDGSSFRSRAIGRGDRIAWTENATSPEVVYDNTLSDSVFNQTWLAASVAIDTNARNVGLVNITDTFRVNQRFSP